MENQVVMILMHEELECKIDINFLFSKQFLLSISKKRKNILYLNYMVMKLLHILIFNYERITRSKIIFGTILELPMSVQIYLRNT